MSGSPFVMSRFVPRSISLTAQLLLTFVGLVLGTTVALTVAAYRSALDSLVDAAAKDVRVTAQARKQTLAQLLSFRQQRAQGFVSSVAALCAEPDPRRGFGWAEDCVNTMLQEFRLTEGAAGVRLRYQDRPVAELGDPVDAAPEPGALARVIWRRDGGADFLMRAVEAGAELTIQFDSGSTLAFFGQDAGLGLSREVFLTDASGRFLTPAQGSSRPDTPAGAVVEPIAACRLIEGERIGLDYRGVLTVHGLQPVPEIGGGCIDAHIAYEEALRPAEALIPELVGRSAIFVVLGVAFSLLAARRIASPVRRLAAAARTLQAGRFDERFTAGGPSEVRALGHAFGAMAEDLAKLIAREQAARRDAEAANRSKDQFLATVSHELRTPLNAILGWTRLLREGQLEPAQTERALNAIQRSAEAQRQLIEDLLDISRIVSGQLRIARDPVPLADIVEASVDVLRPRAADHDVRVELTIDDPGLVVNGDGQRLQQVVWNLVWNGVKFTPGGGTVHVRLRRVGSEAELMVADTGIGISPELLPRVFEWFRQGNAPGEGHDAGLGVGLALVRQLVERHGGTVRAESAGPGRGATFTVTLPLQDSARIGSPAVRDGDRTGSLRHVRVLVVDDDDDAREVAKMSLLHAGAAVDSAASAADARALLERCPYDVLICDIAMPRETGYELVESLRASGVRVPAIALTGYARRDDAERANRAGFAAHMAKPVDPVRLVAAVARLTAESRGS